VAGKVVAQRAGDGLVKQHSHRQSDRLWPVRVQPVGWVEPTGPARSGRPDDRLRETHHPLLCYARAVTNYRQNFIRGGSFFFTANLAQRRLRLLVVHIVSAKDDGFRCRSTHPTGFAIGQIMHCEKFFSRNARYERRGALLRLDVRGLNDRPPLFDLRLLKCGESRGRSLVARCNLLAKLDQTLADR
jgi:hypothetical protein